MRPAADAPDATEATVEVAAWSEGVAPLPIGDTGSSPFIARQPPVVAKGGKRLGRRRGLGLRLSALLIALLVLGSWWFVLDEELRRTASLAPGETLANARVFLERLLGAGEELPAWRDPQRWREALALAVQTLAMSVLAIGIAAGGMLLTVMAAARPLIDGERRPAAAVLSVVVRAGYILARAVPELIWALLIVFVFSPGLLAGALALGLHNLGVVGRLCTETVEALDRRPIQAVRAAGASKAETLLYAVLPAAMPAFLTYVLYRWEVIIRTTVVVGFVAAGGLGREFRLRMSFFHYSDVLLLLLVYVLLVFAVDAASGVLRRLAR